MKPKDSLMAWKKSTALERVEACVVLLNLHGFLTDSERRKVDERIYKWAEEKVVKKKSLKKPL